MTLVSVFTPTHNPARLPEVWRCLQRQTHADWQWTVVPNGEQQARIQATVEALTRGDARVNVVLAGAPYETLNVGLLKRFACEHSQGDLFLEYDHDDLLTDDCLEAVVREAERQAAKAFFIYSDAATVDDAGGSVLYTKELGWRHYDWEFRGRAYRVNRSFAAGPRSLCEILYAPDHVRVWSREAYLIAGGHNPDLRFGDDHDLLVRTYLLGVPFVHIRRPLYIYRRLKAGTSAANVDEIQAQSRATRDRYLHALVKEWCRREGLPMYDLGGAFNCPEGYVPVDSNPRVADVHPEAVCCDVLRGITGKDGRSPLAPGSVGCFRAYDFLEHVPADRVPALLDHLYDLLAPGGWLLTNTPAVCDDEGRCGRGAYQDPTHKSFWSSNNTWYYTKREFARYVPDLRCRFQSVVLSNYYPSDWHRYHLIPYLRWDACALKPANEEGWPGAKEI